LPAKEALRMGYTVSSDRYAESFLRRHALALTLAAVVLTRLPLLFTGYGSDPDAWLAASAAATLWHTGTYVESRLPGYPLHEILSAPAVGLGGAPLANAATLVAALCCVAAWWHIARQHARHPGMLLIAFAFAPAFWQHSAVTLDYVWSLLFILLALLATLNRRLMWAGIMAGVAAGFRLPNILVVIPVVAFALRENVGKKAIVLSVAAAIATAGVAFIPLILKHGGVVAWIERTQWEMRDMTFPWDTRIALFLYRTVYFVGPLAAILLAVGLVRRSASLIQQIRVLPDGTQARNALALASLVAIGTFLILFLWMPVERAYLLPLLPFILLLADSFLSKRALGVFTAVLVLHSVISFDVVQREGPRKEIGFNVHAGMVVQEVHDRLLLLREREWFSSYPYPPKSIVMTGGGSAFWFENTLVVPVRPTAEFRALQALAASVQHRLVAQRRDTTVVFLPYLTHDELRDLQQRGYTVFCTERAKPFVEATVGYALEANNVTIVHFGGK
jgi:hypothetical protein